MIMTETQAAIRDEVRKFARQRVAPFARDYEEAQQYPSRLFEELASRGLMSITAPEAVGGAGADYVSCALSLIEIAAADRCSVYHFEHSKHSDRFSPAQGRHASAASWISALPHLWPNDWCIRGAIALCHPLGAPGAKLLSTLVHALRVRASDMGFRRCARAAASRT